MIHTKASALDELGPSILPVTHRKETSISRKQLRVTPAYVFTEYAQAQGIEYCVVGIGRNNTHLLCDFDEQLVTTRDPNEHLREEDIRFDGATISDEETRLTMIRVQSIGRVDRKVVAIEPNMLHRHSEHAPALYDEFGRNSHTTKLHPLRSHLHIDVVLRPVTVSGPPRPRIIIFNPPFVLLSAP